ncbi:plastocyanin/azurin family copper-binding protein [Halorussus halobius]|uniref:plastocyanin/azurin family copper-binding protein n=1 Tax=Halorussus halobius TaxID=1710537 RepID=UPI00109192C6|nr:plastocyanin/azurin family copper-binding protein [Halorussus halobius]
MTDSTRRRFLRTAAATTLAAGAGALAGCAGVLSDDEESYDDYSLPDASASVEVEMGPDATNLFEPEIAHVEPGGTVTWTNVSRNHSATAYHPDNDDPRRVPEDGDSWDTGVIRENGKSSAHTFEVPGVYDYYCIPHESLAMVGTVVVGDPDPADQPGLQSPSDDVARGGRNKLEELNAKVESALSE